MQHVAPPRNRRPVARHARELLDRRGAAVDADAIMALVGHRLASILVEPLSVLAGGAVPTIRAGTLAEGFGMMLLPCNERGVMHRLLCAGETGQRALLSFDYRGLFELIDRAFGGDGRLPADLPETLPVTGDLLLDKVEEVVRTALSRACAGTPLAVLDPAGSGSDIFLLRPFAANCLLAQLPLSITFAGGAEWNVRLTFPAAIVPLLDDGGAAESPTSPARRRTLADMPFADIALTLSATLVDMRVPLARLAGLRPGMVLPVSVARAVPLHVGGRCIAHGTIGEVDDRVAMRIGPPPVDAVPDTLSHYSSEEPRS